MLLCFGGAVLAVALLAHRASSLFGTSSPDLVGPIYAVAFCPDATHIATANQDGTVRLWDVHDGHEVRRFGKQHPAVVSVAVSSTGKQVVATWNDWMRREYGWIVWDLENGHQMQRAIGHEKTVNDVIFTLDDRQILTASSDRTLRLWDAESGVELFRFHGHEGDVNSVSISPDGRQALSGAGDYWGGVLHDPTVRLWDLDSKQLLRSFAGHEGQVTDAAFSPDEEHVASCSWDGTVRIWDLRTGKEVDRLECPPTDAHLNCLAYSPDGHFIVAGSGFADRGSLHFWNASSGSDVPRFAGRFSVVHSVAFAPGGTTIVSAHGYHGVRPDGATDFFGMPLATALDGVVRVWDAEGGKELTQVGAEKASPSR
ncbi:MAG: WD40 repeat domain-containing protein [Deltaproteobacteria bacterium]